MNRPILVAVLASMLVILSTATAFAAVVRLDFLAPKFYKAGPDPDGIVTGDFDEDGDINVVVTNQESGNVRVFDNNGRGNLSVDDTALAVALSGIGKVAVLKHDGSGTFRVDPYRLDVGNPEAPSPSPLVLADFDKDGALDVATGNVDQGAAGGDADDDVVAVARGKDDGTFMEPTFKSSGGDWPLSLKTGDFNGDRLLDISAANQFCNTSGVNRGNIGVLSGCGDGTFAGPDRFDSGDGPLGITSGRYNADNKLDIATATFGAGGPENETDTVALSINKTP